VSRPRARDLGIPLRGRTGAANAITDVPGVHVGYRTLISGDSVRTGVTAIHPRGPAGTGDPVAAGFFAQNGNGEMTGVSWIEESGTFCGPVGITNTHAVGVVHAAIIAWTARHHPELAESWLLPVAAETWDGYLNDTSGHHVTEEDGIAALEAAASGPVAEGSVGGGTGMNCYQFKAGSGTSSRLLEYAGTGYTVGVFASFYALVGFLLILRAGGSSFDWGFQLQSPAFVAFACLFTFRHGIEPRWALRGGPVDPRDWQQFDANRRMDGIFFHPGLGHRGGDSLHGAIYGRRRRFCIVAADRELLSDLLRNGAWTERAISFVGLHAGFGTIPAEAGKVDGDVEAGAGISCVRHRDLVTLGFRSPGRPGRISAPAQYPAHRHARDLDDETMVHQSNRRSCGRSNPERLLLRGLGAFCTHISGRKGY